VSRFARIGYLVWAIGVLALLAAAFFVIPNRYDPSLPNCDDEKARETAIENMAPHTRCNKKNSDLRSY